MLPPNTKVSIKDSDGSTYKEYRLDLKSSLILTLQDKKMILEVKIIARKFGQFKNFTYLCTRNREDR